MNADSPGSANRIAELRKARGWSMAKLGARCVPPVDGSQINKLEKGMTELSPKWLRTLSAALECNPLEVLPDDLRVAVINFRRVLDAADPPGAAPIEDAPAPADAEPDQPTAEEWEIIRQYREAAETTREIVRTTLAQKPSPPIPSATTPATIFEFKTEHDGTYSYRLKGFWPTQAMIKSER
jgi:transcriptional regulator with XRE-family HTH domain